MFLLRRTAPAEPATITVEHGAQAFTVALRRKPGLRRMTLRVSIATGEVFLSCPERVSTATAAAFARDHAPWIAARVARLPDRIPFEPEASIPLRGDPHRILHWSRVRGRTEATLDASGRAVIAVSCEAPHVSRRVVEFLQAEARRDLGVAVGRYAAALGLQPRPIGVRDTRSRWGSCSASGRLSFSWRLVLAPPMVLDYLAAHEVAHLREMNHSARFWRLVAGLCPNADQAEGWLKSQGNTLHRYG